MPTHRYALGTLCAIDRVPRELNEFQMRMLHTVGNQVMSVLESRRMMLEVCTKVCKTLPPSYRPTLLNKSVVDADPRKSHPRYQVNLHTVVRCVFTLFAICSIKSSG